MSAWATNALAIGLLTLATMLVAAAALWRVSAWSARTIESLTFRHGLPPGATAPQIAAETRSGDAHLSFLGRATLVVFGQVGCDPCKRLVEAAPSHPALRHARLVYLSSSPDSPIGLAPEIAISWEFYRFHDEAMARDRWQAPVSPYFHYITDAGNVAARGVANDARHLDRLFDIPPPGSRTKRLVSKTGN